MELTRNAFTIDVRRLRVLREVQERGTLGATAQALGLTPSAVSQQIASLARKTGVALLARQGRRVRLTPQAMLLLEHATAIDAQLERARADLAAFSDGTVGRIAVGAFATAITGVVAPALVALRRRVPRVQLVIREIEAPACFTELDRGDLDVAITIDHRDAPSHGDARYTHDELLDDPLLVALPARHPAARSRAIQLAALATAPWIVGAVRGPCQEVGLAACVAAGFTPAVAHRVNDWNALLSLVAARLGVGLIPALAVTGAPLRGLVLRPLAGAIGPAATSTPRSAPAPIGRRVWRRRLRRSARRPERRRVVARALLRAGDRPLPRRRVIPATMVWRPGDHPTRRRAASARAPAHGCRGRAARTCGRRRCTPIAFGAFA
jgi:DNA-binding transcriptional LysR family regulator